MNMQTELIYRRAVEATIRECRDEFWIVFQCYGPEKAVFDGTPTLDDMTRVSSSGSHWFQNAAKPTRPGLAARSP